VPAPTSLWTRTLRPLLITLLGGSLGGAAFHAIGLPLAWMLGSMAAVTLLAVCKAQPHIPTPLRTIMLSVLGVMLGSTFRPGFLDHLTDWWPSLLGLLVLTVLTPLLLSPLFRRTGHSVVTSYFAAAPGGINEMVMIGGGLGGDERTIALVHSLRILFVVFCVPICFHLLGGTYPDTSQHQSSNEWLAFANNWPETAVLLACMVLGKPLGSLIRLPAPPLIGPMVLSAIVHLLGWTSLHPPAVLIAIAQVVVGSALGARFRGIAASTLLRLSGVAMVSSLLMILLAMLGAWIVGQATGLPFILLLLSFVPGGVAEMSLVSLALGMDVAFVASHHMVRIALVIALAPPLFRWWYNRHSHHA